MYDVHAMPLYGPVVTPVRTSPIGFEIHALRKAVLTRDVSALNWDLAKRRRYVMFSTRGQRRALAMKLIERSNSAAGLRTALEWLPEVALRLKPRATLDFLVLAATSRFYSDVLNGVVTGAPRFTGEMALNAVASYNRLIERWTPLDRLQVVGLASEYIPLLKADSRADAHARELAREGLELLAARLSDDHPDKDWVRGFTCSKNLKR